MCLIASLNLFQGNSLKTKIELNTYLIYETKDKWRTLRQRMAAAIYRC